MRLVDVLSKLTEVYNVTMSINILYTFIATLPNQERFFTKDPNVLDLKTSLTDSEYDLFFDRYGQVLDL